MGAGRMGLSVETSSAPLTINQRKQVPDDDWVTPKSPYKNISSQFSPDPLIKFSFNLRCQSQFTRCLIFITYALNFLEMPTNKIIRLNRLSLFNIGKTKLYLFGLLISSEYIYTTLPEYFHDTWGERVLQMIIKQSSQLCHSIL